MNNIHYLIMAWPKQIIKFFSAAFIGYEVSDIIGKRGTGTDRNKTNRRASEE